jgi:hypothetical protein
VVTAGPRESRTFGDGGASPGLSGMGVQDFREWESRAFGDGSPGLSGMGVQDFWGWESRTFGDGSPGPRWKLWQRDAGGAGRPRDQIINISQTKFGNSPSPSSRSPRGAPFSQLCVSKLPIRRPGPGRYEFLGEGRRGLQHRASAPRFSTTLQHPATAPTVSTKRQNPGPLQNPASARLAHREGGRQQRNNGNNGSNKSDWKLPHQHIPRGC